MRPFYRSDNVTVYQGNCLDILPLLDNKIDLLLIDPPYGKVMDDDWDQISHAELEKLLNSVFQVARQKMSRTASVCTFCWPVFSARLQNLINNYFHVLSECVWIKRSATGTPIGTRNKINIEVLRKPFTETERVILATMGETEQEVHAESMLPLIEYFQTAKKKSGLGDSVISERMFQLTGKRYVFARHSFGASQWELPTRQQYEAASTFMPLTRPYGELHRQYEELRRYYHPNKKNYTDVWIYSPIQAGSQERLHPTQKPLELISDIITTNSRPGALILDCFAGAGTTGVAAMATGRRAILIERDEGYCAIAAERCRKLL